MKAKRASGARAWSDPDDAPTLTKSFFARAEIRDGEKLVRPPRSRAGRVATLRLDPDVADALRLAGATGRRARTPPSARRSGKPPPDIRMAEAGAELGVAARRGRRRAAAVRRRPITPEAIGSAATYPSLRGALATKQSRGRRCAALGLLRFVDKKQTLAC